MHPDGSRVPPAAPISCERARLPTGSYSWHLPCPSLSVAPQHLQPEFQPSAWRSRRLPGPWSPSLRAAPAYSAMSCAQTTLWYPHLHAPVPPPHIISAEHLSGHRSLLCSCPGSLLPPLISALSFVHLASPRWPGNSPKEVSLHSHSPFPSCFPGLPKLGSARAQKRPPLSAHP